ncbi:hypothetical protein AOC05_07175 [Arthrobacter alpinus]|uniref:DUF3054 domain-containing protein n=1 Tax=Arthrobacter alpinus TaxID=656366 RepID=A0A0M4QPN5_9MICC|nr:DUF3054 domain-containing protein [Arthrobacter alpinus]ALE92166.1 hypothetical protein AOC05_07175 [Arthrobacter alpinus]
MTLTTSRPTPLLISYAVAVDALLVVAFAASGRSSHAESLSIAGVFSTAWPFLAALAIGWLVTRNWLQPVRLWPNGVCIWLITLSGGMALRILSGGTAAFAFVVVATLVLALFLLGHRAIAASVLRRTSKR